MASGTSAQQNASEAPEEDAAELQFPKGKNILVDPCWIIIKLITNDIHLLSMIKPRIHIHQPIFGAQIIR